MRRWHLAEGIVTVVAFLITGQWMRHHDPPMDTLSDSVRLMFRSRHLYILAAGLVNLMLGLYLRHQAARWRRIGQTIGSGMLLASPVLLVVAFAVEPEKGLHMAGWWSHGGLYALFGGCMAHFASSAVPD